MKVLYGVQSGNATRVDDFSSRYEVDVWSSYLCLGHPKSRGRRLMAERFVPRLVVDSRTRK